MSTDPSMTDAPDDSGDRLSRRALTALDDERRRVVVAALAGRSDAVADRRLARLVASREADVPLADLDRGTVEPVLTSLRHAHLPALAAAGLVEYDPDAGTVAPADATGLQPGALVGPEADRYWDAVAALARRPRRGTVLSVLVDHGEAMTVAALASAVAARERRATPEQARTTQAPDVGPGPSAGASGEPGAQRPGDGGAGSRDALEQQIAAALYHTDLPALERADLVSYDRETRLVEPGDPDLLERLSF